MTTAPLTVYRLRAAGSARDTLIAARSIKTAIDLFFEIEGHGGRKNIPESIETVGELEALEEIRTPEAGLSSSHPSNPSHSSPEAAP